MDTWTESVIAAPSGSREVPRRPQASSPHADHARPIRGRYDAAQASDNDSRHWQWSDGLSARAANSPQVRRTLRNRSRYETVNNCYASGIVESLADDMVGAGPLLQMMTLDEGLDETIEVAWGEWCDKVGFADKLHTMRQTRAVDGEAFLFLETDPDLGEIQLDLHLYEADQIGTPYLYPPTKPNQVDGMELDDRGKPRAYHRLKEHPGDTLAYSLGYEYDVIPARYVIHWYLRRRPGQYRGVPELTPALRLFSQLRRYGLATLQAAEFAAANSGVIYTDLPPQNGIANTYDFEAFDYEHGMLTSLPAGWKMGQIDAKQPTANHAMFKQATLEEIARALKVPYNVASGNSSGYNYASGRLDDQRYYRSIGVDQARANREICSRILREWLMEAAKATRMLPGGYERRGGWPHRWIWPAKEHVDPMKEAKAQQTRLQSMTTTFTEECYRDGTTPEKRRAVMAQEVKDFKKDGLPSPYGVPQVNVAQMAQDQADQAAEDAADEQGGGGDGQDDSSGVAGGAGGYHARRNGFHRP
jgi:lambda family phage portal protein